MNRLKCTTDKYEDLYTRWITHPLKLLQLANVKAGDRIVDLCGGTGVVSTTALDWGIAEAVLVDLNPRVRVVSSNKLVQITGEAERLDELIARHRRNQAEVLNKIRAVYGLASKDVVPIEWARKFDSVICRQAIGYLDVGRVGRAVANVLKSDGRFVFNNFSRPRWGVKTYLYGNKRFFEASAYLGKTVLHLQAGFGVGVDVTKFKWYTDAELKSVLAPYFDVVSTTEGRSTYYVCTLRDRE